MIHPSYTELMKVVNSEVEPGEVPVVNSRYSIVMATSKKGRKPLSIAVDELNQGKIKIMGDEKEEE